jgi:ABC-type uncharacterized transport system ATPase subunit
MAPMISSGFQDDLPAGHMESSPLLSIQGITKRFGPVWANRDISMEIRHGEIHALVGENGAGKSTLLKILFGQLRPDSGMVFLEGRPTGFRHPGDAMSAGFGMVHQQLLIFPQLSALENVILGGEPRRWGRVLWKEAEERVGGLARVFGFTLPLHLPAGLLPFAHRQQIEILRALHHNARILLLDEPSSLLGPLEIKQLMDLLVSLKERGHTILLVSHRLDEVFSVANRISVLHQGRFHGTYRTGEVTPEDLAGIMVSGRESATEAEPAFEDLRRFVPDNGKSGTAEPVLEIRNVHTVSLDQEAGLDDFTLEIFPGEIFGIGAVVGNGERSLGRLIAGLIHPVRGELRFQGHGISTAPVSTRLDMGIRWLPANPLEEALMPGRPLWENLLMGRQRERAFQTMGWLKKRQIRDWAAKCLESAHVACSSPVESLRSLSGGNQQKVALSRIMTDSITLAVLEQPGRGLDVHAQGEIHRRMKALSTRGAAFVVISYDLGELLALCHRMGILFRGRLVGTVSRADASREVLGRWMVGLR